MKKKLKKGKYTKYSLFIILLIISMMFFYLGGDKLLKNTDQYFNNFSEEAGSFGQEYVNKLKNIDYSNKKDSNTVNDSNREIIYINSADLQVYFIDVGQGDSILLISNNESMLIDAGTENQGEKVVNYIKAKGISKLKYVVGTHPHDDHIGGLSDVVQNFDIENIFMPNITTNTKTYEDLLTSINNKNLKVKSPKNGEKFTLGNANVEVMTTPILNKNNFNLSSIVLRVTYKENSFLLMGDAESENESTRKWPNSDVLKVGHHGSTTSTTANFLKQIKPKYAVISVGENNEYKLPDDPILKRLQSSQITTYRTDTNGSISMISDGNKINIYTEK